MSQSWTINPVGSQGQVSTWVSAIGNYPSNADVWWTFKNTSQVFDPTTTINNVTLGTGPAPKGFYILSAFNQQRSAASGQAGLTNITTTKRPKTGAWFQGRVWYSGVDASFPTSNNPTSWSESIYFSQIITTPAQFGRCYQTNDPTSETLFDLLPSDGGTISIQGCGSIYKLYPVQNGLLVFAANGIWFITGNQGIGFSATDFTVSKLSGEHSISGTSFVDVQGYPAFWNNDGIYFVAPGESQTSGQRSLQVKNITLPTIKQFYQNIPLASKLFARGSYNHLTGIIQWVYRSTVETDITSRYTFDSILNFLTYTEAFYNWEVSNPSNTILGITYVETTGSTPSVAPNAVFKYLTSANVSTVFSGNITFIGLGAGNVIQLVIGDGSVSSVAGLSTGSIVTISGSGIPEANGTFIVDVLTFSGIGRVNLRGTTLVHPSGVAVGTVTGVTGSALTFSEERDNVNWQDWASSSTMSNYTSSFETGYRLKGKGQRKFQTQYIYIFSEIPAYQYMIDGVWDYAATTASNRFSAQQIIVVNKPSSYFKDIRKIRIRGSGYVLQYTVTSVPGKPFNISGWSILDTIGIE